MLVQPVDVTVIQLGNVLDQITKTFGRSAVKSVVVLASKIKLGQSHEHTKLILKSLKTQAQLEDLQVVEFESVSSRDGR